MDELTRELLAAREGDRLAFAAVVRRAQADVWRYCAHLVGREAPLRDEQDGPQIARRGEADRLDAGRSGRRYHETYETHPRRAQ